MVNEHSDDARDGSMRASPPSVLRGLRDAPENAEPGTPVAASEFLRIGQCLQPRFELGRGHGYERVLPVKDDGGNRPARVNAEAHISRRVRWISYLDAPTTERP